jgi:hypothetical protein
MISLSLIICVYLMIMGIFLYYLRKIIRNGPTSHDKPHSTFLHGAAGDLGVLSPIIDSNPNNSKDK